jgi:D-sedoheptulose 7-phosphate isomerase
MLVNPAFVSENFRSSQTTGAGQWGSGRRGVALHARCRAIHKTRYDHLKGTASPTENRIIHPRTGVTGRLNVKEDGAHGSDTPHLFGSFALFFREATINLPVMSHLQRAIEESIATLRSLSTLEEPLSRAAQLLLQSLTSGHKLLACGNGGSASDATHLATEFLCRFREERRPYPAISLTANGEFMTAVCNDYHADEIFARQVWGLAQKGDVLLVITTSGKSKNIVRALEEARRMGVDSIAILGRDGGFTKGLATVDLIVPGTLTARIQEAQKVLFHALCEMVEEKLPKN